jgi:hypothetical protein
MYTTVLEMVKVVKKSRSLVSVPEIHPGSHKKTRILFFLGQVRQKFAI